MSEDKLQDIPISSTHCSCGGVQEVTQYYYGRYLRNLTVGGLVDVVTFFGTL